MRINTLIRIDPVPPVARDAAPLPLSAAPTADGHAAPAPFANLLRQTQTAPAQPPPATATNAGAEAASPAPEGHDSGAPEADAAADAAAKPHAPARPRLRSPDKAAAPAHPQLPTDAATTARAEAAKADSAAPTLDPAMAAWLAALHAAPATPRGEGQASTSDGEPTATDASVSTGTKARATAELHAAVADKAEQAALGKARDALPATEAPSAAARAEATDARQALAAPVPAERNDSLPGLNAAVFNPAPTALRDAPPPAAMALATPVDAADFSKMLGLQVSVLAQGGVQQAELHLNPADMGPVSVQIVMDGNRAQVDFGADVAATRHAIEAGLPELASALREAGFTLTGGGVSQHSRGRSHDSAGTATQATRGTRRANADDLADLADAARAATRRTVRLGGLDLYA